MKRSHLFNALFALVAIPAAAWAAPGDSVTNVVPKLTQSGDAYPDPPSPLPGNGLAEHDFLYSGEFDTRNTNQTMFLIKGGKVAWTYQIPTYDRNHNLSEFSDMHRLSNGDIVFAYKTGWRKIDQDGKILHDYICPRERSGWTECHSAQPIGNDRVLFMRNGVPARLFLYNISTGKMEMEHVMKTREPATQKSVHGQFRNVRMTKAGTYLIAHMDLGKVIEYDRDWKPIWSCDAPSVWDAVRLKNGNTLISGNQHGFVREVNPDGEIAWQIEKGDLPGIAINGAHEVMRLANGNTVICNWTAGVKKENWPKIVQLIEVTPERKVVWAINQWKDPDLGPASCVQFLDETGRDEEQELER